MSQVTNFAATTGVEQQHQRPELMKLFYMKLKKVLLDARFSPAQVIHLLQTSTPGLETVT